MNYQQDGRCDCIPTQLPPFAWFLPQHVLDVSENPVCTWSELIAFPVYKITQLS